MCRSVSTVVKVFTNALALPSCALMRFGDARTGNRPGRARIGHLQSLRQRRPEGTALGQWTMLSSAELAWRIEPDFDWTFSQRKLSFGGWGVLGGRGEYC